MFSRSHGFRLLLIRKFTRHSKPPSFAFSGFSTVYVSPQCSNDESPNNSNISSSFTVSYLIDSCGLSPEIAVSTSKKVKLKTPKRPDSVLELLRNNGFSNTQISRFVAGKPALLLYDPEKTLLPKFKFFYSIGFSKDDLAEFMSYCPSILLRSLNNRIIPSYHSIRSVLSSDKKVISVFNRGTFYITSKHLVSNITALRKINVPASNIELLTTNYTRTVLQNHDQFIEAIDKVKRMGFDPLKSTFVLALRVFSVKDNNVIWDRCSETYKKWGWSEEDILSAFKKHPHTMMLSTDKIDRAMDLLVNKLGFQSTAISKMPVVLFYDVAKRVVPRCSVLQVLTSKGIVKKWNLLSVLAPSEKIFLERFVTRYEDQLPHLIQVYRGEVNTKAS